MTASIEIDDKEVQKMLKGMMAEFQTGPKGAKAGYLSGDKGETPSDEPSLPDISDIAIWNEFGTYNIPPRPFMREAQKTANKRCENAVKGLLDDGTDMETVVKQIAQLLSATLKQSIRNGHWDANAPITIHGGWMRNKKSGKLFYIKGKKSSRPLIDTGNLQQSIHTAIITKNNGEIQQE